jgi:hypothetical protein
MLELGNLLFLMVFLSASCQMTEYACKYFITNEEYHLLGCDAV